MVYEPSVLEPHLFIFYLLTYSFVVVVVVVHCFFTLSCRLPIEYVISLSGLATSSSVAVTCNTLFPIKSVEEVKDILFFPGKIDYFFAE